MCISILGVIAAAIAKIIIGSLWYSKLLFGQLWLRFSNVTPDAKSMQKAMAGSMVSSFVIASIMGCFMARLGINSIESALCFGFMAWLGFVATVSLENTLWNKQNITMYFISMGSHLIGILTMAVILSQFI